MKSIMAYVMSVNQKFLIPGLDDRNEDAIEEEFRKKKELITISDIKKNS